jgi:hypothetical protein
LLFFPIFHRYDDGFVEWDVKEKMISTPDDMPPAAAKKNSRVKSKNGKTKMAAEEPRLNSSNNAGSALQDDKIAVVTKPRKKLREHEKLSISRFVKFEAADERSSRQRASTVRLDPSLASTPAEEKKALREVVERNSSRKQKQKRKKPHASTTESSVRRKSSSQGPPEKRSKVASSAALVASNHFGSSSSSPSSTRGASSLPLRRKSLRSGLRPPPPPPLPPAAVNPHVAASSSSSSSLSKKNKNKNKNKNKSAEAMKSVTKPMAKKSGGGSISGTSSAQPAPRYKQRSRVDARWNGDPDFYPGRVTKCQFVGKSGRGGGWEYSILYDDGYCEHGVPEGFIRKPKNFIRIPAAMLRESSTSSLEWDYSSSSSAEEDYSSSSATTSPPSCSAAFNPLTNKYSQQSKKLVRKRIRDNKTGQLGLVTKSTGKGWFEIVLDGSNGKATKRRPTELTFLEEDEVASEEDEDDDDNAMETSGRSNSNSNSNSADIAVSALLGLSTNAAEEAEQQQGPPQNWVQCNDCGKWRQLPQSVCMRRLCERPGAKPFACHMNKWDGRKNRCGAPEAPFFAGPEALQCGSLTIRAPHHTAILSATTVSRAGLGDAAMRFEEAARIWHMP